MARRRTRIASWKWLFCRWHRQTIRRTNAHQPVCNQAAEPLGRFLTPLLGIRVQGTYKFSVTGRLGLGNDRLLARETNGVDVIVEGGEYQR